MEAQYIDTHIVIWLVSGRLDIFPKSVLEGLDESQLNYSSMVEFELTYLWEKEKLTIPSSEIIHILENDFGCLRKDSPMSELINKANKFSWTRDPFDRLITAQASLFDLPLITKDKTIRSHYHLAVW